MENIYFEYMHLTDITIKIIQIEFVFGFTLKTAQEIFFNKHFSQIFKCILIVSINGCKHLTLVKIRLFVVISKSVTKFSN